MMIKEICLIAMVACGLTVVIPGTNVVAQQLQSTSLPNHGAQIPVIASHIAGIGLTVASIVKFKAHKDNPTQIPISIPIHLPFK